MNQKIKYLFAFLSFSICALFLYNSSNTHTYFDFNHKRVLASSGDVSFPPSSFYIDNLFEVHFNFDDTAGTITTAVKFNIVGQYFSLGFGSYMSGSDMWVFEIASGAVTAEDYKSSGHTPILDTSNGGTNDLVVLGYEITSSYSLIKIERKLNTGDSNDAILHQGTRDFIWATGNSPSLVDHDGTRGTVNIPFTNGVKGFVATTKKDNSNYIHAILHLVAWGILVDIAILVVRLLRGTKFTLGKITISAQMIHSGLMWIVFIMGTYATASLLNKSITTTGFALTGVRSKDFHFVVGLIMLGLSAIEMVNGMTTFFTQIQDKGDQSKLINIKTFHKINGILLYLLGKANILAGVVFYNNGAWKVGVPIYFGILFLVHVVITGFYLGEYRNSNRDIQTDRKASTKPEHVSLMTAINAGLPREKLLAEYPKIKWVMLGNRVYDLTGFTHPGGNFIIEACVGREVGRFFYGNYALEGTNMKPYKHSALTLRLIGDFYIGEVTNYENILIAKALETNMTLTPRPDGWKIASTRKVSATISEVNFVSDDFAVKNFGTSVSWLGRHFAVSFDRNSSPARLYTTAISLNTANFAFRQSLFQFFDKVMAGEKAEFSYDPTYLAPQDHLPIYIKRYPFNDGLSKAIHDIDLGKESNRFRVTGPVSRGLELLPINTGSYCIICAGTGVLPFVDFLNFFLWKNIYQLIKDKAGEEQAQKINVFNIPFDKCMNNLKIEFIGAFQNEGEIMGLDIIKKLAEISKKYGKQNFNATMKGYSDDNIAAVKESFSEEFLRKSLTTKQERYYIVGPPGMNREVPKALMRLGVSENKIVLV